MIVAGYHIECRPEWRDIVVQPVDDGGAMLKAALAADIELKLIIWPGGGMAMIDRYFKTLVDRFADGTLRGFHLSWGDLEFNGWYVVGAAALSDHPDACANFYAAEHNGDAICWALYSLGPRPADLDHLESECLQWLCVQLEYGGPS